MMTKQKKRILICCISPAEDGFFVPTIYGNLRSWCDDFLELREGYDWLGPVMLPVEYSDLNKEFDFSSIDVLGISCYQWNYRYLYDLATHIKAANPRCTVVAGGPQVEYRQSDYFVTNPEIDFAVPGEGEIAFQQILFYLMGVCQLEDLQGSFINPRLGFFEYQPAQEINLTTRPSPWLSIKDFWAEYFEKNYMYRLAINYESSRGCPYGCTYCDWGGNSNNRLRVVPTEIVKEELNFIQRYLRPTFMFWADANLGIVQRDAELAEYLAQQKIRTGRPQWLYYNCNKNNYEINVQIAEYFRNANLLTKYVLALQHMDPDVLLAIKRTNLPMPQIRLLVEQLQNKDCPLFVQLIAGCPGDTFDKWLCSFASLMDMGVHGEYRVYPFSLLPNSPAALPGYCDEWKLDIIERPDYVAYFNLRDRKKNWALSKSRYVVGSKTMNRDEYLQTLELGCLFMAFHDHGFTRRIAIALNDSNVLTYAQFYRVVYYWFFESEEMRIVSRHIRNHFYDWIANEDSGLLVYNEEIEGMVEPEEALVWDIFEHFDFFFTELKSHLTYKYNVPASLLNYQRDILYRPELQPEEIVNLPGEWAHYFDSSLDLSGNYGADMSGLQFEMPLWYKNQDKRKRSRMFYSQMIQHNLASAERTIFKKLHNLYRLQGDQ